MDWVVLPSRRFFLRKQVSRRNRVCLSVTDRCLVEQNPIVAVSVLTKEAPTNTTPKKRLTVSRAEKTVLALVTKDGSTARLCVYC